MRPPVRFQRPQLPPDAAIESYFDDSRRARWFSNGGPCHEQLTSRLEQYVGHDAQIVLTANATLGLMIALRSLLATADSRGPVVITPSFTFPATAQAIFWNGLRPLWVDVEADGWHLDPDALDVALAAHGTDVAAVLACSTFGTAPAPSQAAAWDRSCASAGVPLLIDSAAGFGSRDRDGRLLGTHGAAEVFSFHATKSFAIGEGGAVSTTDRELAKRIAGLSNFGLSADREISSPFGLNAKMSELHAAIGLAELDRFDDVLEARRRRAVRIREQLEPAGYRFQAGAEGSTWQFVPVLAPSAEVRATVLANAAEEQIEIRSYHMPLHRVDVFATHVDPAKLPVTERLAELTLSLPLSNDLDEAQAARICELLIGCAQSSARPGSMEAR